jgi:uncharacterized protein with von Willebrand factor type A (vWA) domain
VAAEHASPQLLRGVDRAAFAVALAVRLRDRGVPVGLTAIEVLARALAVSPPRSRSALYWTARISLVRHQSELAAFDAMFAAVFDDAMLELGAHRAPPIGPSGEDRLAPVSGGARDEQAGSGLPWVSLPPVVAGAEDSDADFAVPERLPSALAARAEAPFDQLSAAETRLLGQWLAAAVRVWPARRTRRTAVATGGHRIALRSTIARSRRTGWEPIELVHVRAVHKPRPVVMLCDVSQSMQAQATAYLYLMRALTLATDAEVFAFATTLTRLTGVLAHRSPEAAIEQATGRVADRFGGTRIATNVQDLLASHHGHALRGAIVIVASDGWDSDPATQLAAAMARLRRRAYRVIWLNPRAAAPGFTPQVSAMAAALPYCDSLLPADTFGSLAAAIGEISSAVSSTRSRGSRDGTARR